MELAFLLILLAVLLAIGVPVAFALGASSLATFLLMDITTIVALQRMAAGMNVFVLMAIPFFVFAGDLMARTGIADRLVKVAEGAFGRARGGLGQVDVGASMMFGAVSGSAIASVSAMGSTLMPMMREKGYDADYAVNVTITAAILGILIPPSHNMIIYAAASPVSVSVGDLFLAGIIPGLLAGFALMFVAWRVAVKRNYPKGEFPGWSAFLRAFIGALPGLMTALIIVFGILLGVFTPTESSAVAVIYTILVGIFVYRTLGFRTFMEAASGAVKTTAMVMLIIGAAGMFGWLFALLEGPSALAAALTSFSDSPVVVLLLILLMLLVLGAFMDMAPLIIITTPILLPVAMDAGVDPVQFGIVMLLNLGIGLVSPPVGSVLFVGCAVGKARPEDVVRTIWPFYSALIVVMLMITFIPELTLWLPGLF
ncbi:TRAP transporter large permease [uncultured Hyphomonas sp.]|jgi:tripartite ATP-independent transporter DctM subunit|uniref:TRAP transporter large permease n=1 Tax=uncultured Hyphomonas sp. TaxID=225298 RepID=UPI000C37577D|nr:C4-dicarboxylate ABC transporter permease [Hyphomonadaceae bacterium]MBA29018.1 C4-dicarboxylate ABC transporter permease [Hyphomonadaceae bacterium]|tara:strand:+ start:403 stop:1680 length:1278 start_codon:yes stop_codon:yes gene_type:complete